MTTIVEDVAKAIANHNDAHYANRDGGWLPGDSTWGFFPEHHDDYRKMAEAAIAAARPHIRAELFAELIAEAALNRVQVEDECLWILNTLFCEWETEVVETWLNARKEADNAQ